MLGSSVNGGDPERDELVEAGLSAPVLIVIRTRSPKKKCPKIN